MSLRRFGVYFIAGVLLVVAAGLVYWLLTKNNGEVELKSSLAKVDSSSNILKASVEQNNVFQSDYIGELITAGCLLTAVIIYKLAKWKCKTMGAPIVTPDPPPPAAQIIPPPPVPAPVQPYLYNFHTAPPSYATVVPPSYTDQAKATTSNTTARYKKTVIPTVESSSTETSSDSETPVEVIAAAAAAKKKRKRKRKNKTDVTTTAPLDNATT